MADAAEVFAGIARRPGTRYTALVPNLAGLERARSPRASAKSRSSPPRPRPSAAGTSTRRSTSRSRPTRRSATRARGAGHARARLRVDGVRLPVRRRRRAGAASPTSPRALIELGVFEVAVSDTIGIAHPGPGAARRSRRSLARVPLDAVALHFHDTRGTALANVLTALRLRHHDVRRVGRRPRRLPVRAGRGRQPRHRGSDLHAGRAGDRDRRRSREAWSRRRRFIEPRVGHPLPSRYYRARHRRQLAAQVRGWRARLAAAPPSTRQLARRSSS